MWPFISLPALTACPWTWGRRLDVFFLCYTAAVLSWSNDTWMDTYIINISELYKKENKSTARTAKDIIRSADHLQEICKNWWPSRLFERRPAGNPAGATMWGARQKNYSKNAGMSSKKAEPGSTIAELVRLLEWREYFSHWVMTTLYLPLFWKWQLTTDRILGRERWDSGDDKKQKAQAWYLINLVLVSNRSCAAFQAETVTLKKFGWPWTKKKVSLASGQRVQPWIYGRVR